MVLYICVYIYIGLPLTCNEKLSLLTTHLIIQTIERETKSVKERDIDPRLHMVQR